MDEIVKILEDEGFEVFEGANAVRRAIRRCADDSIQSLCSGYRVFPDGRKCKGCSDCKDD